MPTLSEILPLVTALGIGGTIGVIVKYLLDKNSESKLKLKTINEEKYRTILIYMSLSLEPKNLAHFILHDNTLLSLKSEESIREYSISKLKEYYYHSLLYASDDVMRAMKGFISEPSRVNYIRTAQKMRTDLWGKKTKLTEKELLEP